MYQEAALAVLCRSVLLHQRRCSLVAQERADQIDVHDFGEELTRHRAAFPQYTAGTDHPGAVDQQIDAAHPALRGLHGGVDLGLGGDIATDEGGAVAEIGSGGPAGAVLYVEHHDFAAQRDDAPRDCVAESRGTACDDGTGVLDLHCLPLVRVEVYPISSTATATASPPPMQREAMPRRPPRRRKA